MSEIREPVWSGFGEDPLLSCRLPTSFSLYPPKAERQPGISLGSLF